jgi:hypothetical protein
MGKADMRVVPLTLTQANAYITQHHRHHKPVVGHRFSIGAWDDGLVGVCVVGRPVARGCDPYFVAEVTRLATDGSPNACSFLYGAAARVCKHMGFRHIQTYVLQTEPGTSLKATGWRQDGMTAGGDWNNGRERVGTRRIDQPMTPKQRWVKDLN